MRWHKNQEGFTLLEIMIVIIIIGVLTSLALPRLFRTVEYSKAAEALTSLNAVRQSIERCYLMRGNVYTNCNTFTNLDVDNPAASPNSHFTYNWPSAPSASAFTIRANRTTFDGGTAGDFIQITNNGATITRNGTGNFSGVQ